MKRIIVFAICFVVGLAVATAEQGKGKRKQGQAAAGGGGKGKHAMRAGGGTGGGSKHAKMNRQGSKRRAAMNANEGGGGQRAGGGRKAGRKAQFKERSGEGVNAVAGEGKMKAKAGGGRRAQVKHFDFANTKRTNIESVTFHANRRIVGAHHWHGERYVVFRNYRPIWHDHSWWHAHYPRIVLIAGGWYFWNAGFWYPAWGYDPGASVYAYDGPIYAYNDLPPDQVVANVQQALQEQGYYQGEIDGMLGPLTRAALADYQRDHGLYTTSAIDEPTMASLGFEGAQSG